MFPYTIREVFEAMTLAALFSTPCWLGILLDKF